MGGERDRSKREIMKRGIESRVNVIKRETNEKEGVKRKKSKE